MKSKLTLLSLFLAATLITSQVSAAEEKTTTVDPVATADKSSTTDTTIDKSASTDATAPDSDEGLPMGTDWQTLAGKVADILLSDIAPNISKQAFESIQGQVCKKGKESWRGCFPPYTIRSCGGVLCTTGNSTLNTAIVALCGGYTDKDGPFSKSGCATKGNLNKINIDEARKTMCTMTIKEGIPGYSLLRDIQKIFQATSYCK